MGLFDRFRGRRSATSAPPRPKGPPWPVLDQGDRAPVQAIARRAPAHRIAGEVALTELEICVIDTETTGFGHEDRVVEIACVRMAPDGSVLDHLCTLLHPDRPVAASFVHGITDEDLQDAPRFAEVAPEISRLAHGALLVAHNAPFDARMLSAEFRRLGHEPQPAWACTMRLRRSVGLPGPVQHKLAWAAWQEGLDITPDHHALQDALVAAALADCYLARARERDHHTLGDLAARGAMGQAFSQPLGLPTVTGTAGRLRSRAGHGPPRLPARLDGRDERGEYRALLERALADFVLSDQEILELEALARRLRLSHQARREAHLHQLQRMVRLAASDHHIDWAEQRQARAFATAVGLPAEDLDALLADHEQAGVSVQRPAPANRSPGASRRRTVSPDAPVRVAFTGPLDQLTRQDASDMASAHGLQVSGSVSRLTDLLVTNQPGVMTGKLKKAQEHGTVICDERTFLAMCGVPPITPDLTRVLQHLQQRRTPTGQPEAAAPRSQARGDERPVSPASGREARTGSVSPLRGELPDGTKVLWCEAGQHEWQRPSTRGRLPHSCPHHRR
ncbi:exonuclease domain-containing protein [Paraconexibacter sp.]|uniref:exonuclease domain-containing protein n=1 Tax=Paraconexibacter sp. TaxID=2949640 RepID=UPI00356787C5